MTFNYAGLRDGTALQLLTNFGQYMTLTKKSNDSFNPDTNTLTQSTSTQTVKGVILDFADRNRGVRFGDDSQIRQGDRRVIMSASGLLSPPAIGDTLTVGAVIYTIVQFINEVSPAGTVVIYDLHVRL